MLPISPDPPTSGLDGWAVAAVSVAGSVAAGAGYLGFVRAWWAVHPAGPEDPFTPRQYVGQLARSTAIAGAPVFFWLAFGLVAPLALVGGGLVAVTAIALVGTQAESPLYGILSAYAYRIVRVTAVLAVAEAVVRFALA
ncbi:hypothetical protein [Halosimplex marinum]|uniref:hypothetical protein n=1 Tax=Halosimplex marinum TaxID=3396620 RepID=UPI003F55AEA4